MNDFRNILQARFRVAAFVAPLHPIFNFPLLMFESKSIDVITVKAGEKK